MIRSDNSQLCTPLLKVSSTLKTKLVKMFLSKSTWVWTDSEGCSPKSLIGGAKLISMVSTWRRSGWRTRVWLTQTLIDLDRRVKFNLDLSIWPSMTTKIPIKLNSLIKKRILSRTWIPKPITENKLTLSKLVRLSNPRKKWTRSGTQITLFPNSL